MRTLPLPSRKYLRECFDYSPQTGELRWRARPLTHFQKKAKPGWLAERNQASWNRKYAGRPFGKISTDGSHIGVVDYVYYKAHRIIFKWMTGTDPIQVDHRDRDRLNNRWDNLRNATQAQNQANVGAMRHNKVGLKGVRRVPWHDGFTARISMMNRKSVSLGFFPTAEAAHAAYCVAAQARWGEFWSAG
jgi:hypothetical protein